MHLNSRQKLIITELSLEKEFAEIQNLEIEIELKTKEEIKFETKTEIKREIKREIKLETKLIDQNYQNQQNSKNSIDNLSNSNQISSQISSQIPQNFQPNLETQENEQKLKILKAKLITKIQKSWQIYDQKSEIQKFCPYVQIKLCDGICGHKETLENYNLKIDQIKTILGGKIKRAKLFLEDKITDAIERENYPLAALWRDRIKYLEDLTIDQSVVLNSDEDLDLCTLVMESLENGLILGSIFVQNIREGKVVNVSNYLLSGSSSGENKSKIAFSFWQRFLSTFVVSNTNFAPTILQTFWN